MNKLITAWDYLLAHHYFNACGVSTLQEGLEVHVDVVNPKTNKVSKNPKKNTKSVVGFEVSVAVVDLDSPRGFYLAHEMRLDVWADSFEQAVIALAERVSNKSAFKGV